MVEKPELRCRAAGGGKTTVVAAGVVPPSKRPGLAGAVVVGGGRCGGVRCSVVWELAVRRGRRPWSSETEREAEQKLCLFRHLAIRAAGARSCGVRGHGPIKRQRPRRLVY